MVGGTLLCSCSHEGYSYHKKFLTVGLGGIGCVWWPYGLWRGRVTLRKKKESRKKYSLASGCSCTFVGVVTALVPVVAASLCSRDAFPSTLGEGYTRTTVLGVQPLIVTDKAGTRTERDGKSRSLNFFYHQPHGPVRVDRIRWLSLSCPQRAALPCALAPAAACSPRQGWRRPQTVAPRSSGGSRQRLAHASNSRYAACLHAWSRGRDCSDCRAHFTPRN